MRLCSFFAFLSLVKNASQAISTAELSGLGTIGVNNDHIHTCCHNLPRMDQPPRVAKRRIFPHILERLPPIAKVLVGDGRSSNEKTLPEVKTFVVHMSYRREIPIWLGAMLSF